MLKYERSLFSKNTSSVFLSQKRHQHFFLSSMCAKKAISKNLRLKRSDAKVKFSDAIFCISPLIQQISKPYAIDGSVENADKLKWIPTFYKSTSLELFYHSKNTFSQDNSHINNFDIQNMHPSMTLLGRPEKYQTKKDQFEKEPFASNIVLCLR